MGNAAKVIFVNYLLKGSDDRYIPVDKKSAGRSRGDRIVSDQRYGD